MESEEEKLIQNVEDEESDFEQKDVEDENVASEDIQIPETTNSTYVKNENVKIKPELIDTLDIYNILNTNEVFSKSDVVFDVTETKTFHKLPPGTNLKVPPDNWPNPNVNLPNPIQIKIKTEESASFSIANMFPECNNKTDIVADADVIKEIFKIPYNKEYFSATVRKIGNVLLIDNFERKIFSKDKEDITEYKQYLADLKKIHSDLLKTNNSNEKLRQRNLHSKFLYKSFVDDLEPYDRLTSTVHKFDRIIYWSFEKIRMILGTDNLKTNLSENGTSRNVSLHIAPAEKPLKILNAIDMWLDNLMCDVPEAVICFHSDSIVKHYEYIQTQDIPYMEGSQFSVTKIKMLVENIFSFLHNREYQPGQVYWLIKCKNQTVFKFINLNMTEKTDGQVKMMRTPFAYECGIFSYRLGHNQYYIFNNRKDINHLLDVSILTLNSEIHPEIIASASYLIVHLKFSYEIFKTSLFTLNKVEFRKCKKEPESVKSRCFDALVNINAGLKCLQYFRVSNNSQEKKVDDVVKTDNFQKGKFKLKKDKKQVRDENYYINVSLLFPKKEHRALEVLPTWENINEDRDYWKNYLKFLFYQKAELIYAILFQEYFYYNMYEKSLRCLDMMVRCNQVKTKIEPSSHTIPFHFVMIMLADCYELASAIKLPKNLNFNKLQEIENNLKNDEEYYKLESNNFHLELNLTGCFPDEMLEIAIQLYDEALYQMCAGNRETEVDEDMHFIFRKLFLCNLSLALSHCADLDTSEDVPDYMDHFEISKEYINSAFEAAISTIDKALAKFHCGKLHFVLFSTSLNKVLPLSEEKQLLGHFRTYLDCTKDALQILYDGNDAKCEQEWKRYFNNFFSLHDKIMARFNTDLDSKIVEKLRTSVLECSLSGLKEILKLCELQYQRNKDDFCHLACGKMYWFLAGNLFTAIKVGIKAKFSSIHEYFNKAIKICSQQNTWKFYFDVLANFNNFVWYQSQDVFDFPMKKKMENIRYSLKLYYEAGIKLQEVPNDEDVPKPIIDGISSVPFNVHQTLSRGLELIKKDPRVTKTAFNELETFTRYLEEFDKLTTEDSKLFLTGLIDTLKQMGISMKFAN